MAELGFNLEEVYKVISGLKDSSDNMNKVLSDCINIFDRIGTNVWSGERATRYKKEWETYSSSFNEFKKMIDDNAAEINQEYEEAHRYENN